MAFKFINDRQVLQVQALGSSIGTAANTTLDTIFAQIDARMVNLNGIQTITNKTLNGNNNTLTVLATSQISGVIPIVNGGTNNGSLSLVPGGVIYTDGTRLQTSPAGSIGQTLISGGTGAPTWSSGGAGLPIGADFSAYLTLAQMQAQMGTGWVLAAGQSAAGSAWETISGLSSITLSANATATNTGVSMILSAPVETTTANTTISNNLITINGYVSGGPYAQFSGFFPGPFPTYIVITANNPNTNIISPSFWNGSTVNSSIAAWNAANPSNQVTLTFGSGAGTTFAGNASIVGIFSGQLVTASGITPGTTVTSTGNYTFTVTSANATAGATYTSGGNTFTVVSTIVAGTTLICTGTGSPNSNVTTLTKTGGTGDATITYSAVILGVNLSANATATASSVSTTFSSIAATITGNTTISTNSVTGLSTTTGVSTNLIVTATGIPSGTTISGITVATVPNLCGLVIRGKNNGRSDGHQDPAGEQPLGTYEGDTTAVNGLHDTGHAHGLPGAPNYAGNGTSPAFTNNVNVVPNTETSSAVLAGDAETRVKAIILNWFFRIN